MNEAHPYSKETQLARGERRHHRRKASAGTWQRIIDAKRGPCRCCGQPALIGSPIEYHHLIPRAQGGDDVPENIVPVHDVCHAKITERRHGFGTRLCHSLTDEEYAYCIQKGGEGVFERVFGLEYAR
ncbi:MAG TPA: HNH endonuclease signature motif containing protein [Methylomirabilota bacterium]|nr:HNH endonuclease signature motif containing protein [Methylomirabilota bacterium]